MESLLIPFIIEVVLIFAVFGVTAATHPLAARERLEAQRADDLETSASAPLADAA